MGGNSPRGRYDFEDISRLNALLDHDLLLNWVANKHIDWTNATDNLLTTGSGRFDGGVGIGTDPISALPLRIVTSHANSTAIRIDNTGTGNPVVQFALSGTVLFVMGIDDSDSDRFKISSGTTLGAPTLIIDSSINLSGIGTITSGAINTLHIVPGTDPTWGSYVFLSGDGTTEDGGLSIAIPYTAGKHFAYGRGGTEHHFFGAAGNTEITDDGQIITYGVITSIANTLNLGDNSSANDTVINFLSSGNDGDITYDQSDDEFDFGNAAITTTDEVTSDMLVVGDGVYHLGDLDTNFWFLPNRAGFHVGGMQAFEAKTAFGAQVIFNPAGADMDIKIFGATDDNLLYTNAGTDRVGIGTNAPAAKLDVVGAALISTTLGVTGVATLGDSSQMATSAAPTADADIANKKYVDDSVVASAYSGNYTGDGTESKAIAGVGFTPKYVKITDRKTVNGNAIQVYWTNSDIIDDNANGGAIRVDNDGFQTFAINAIISFDADGFTVDDGAADDHPNKDGITYNFICMG